MRKNSYFMSGWGTIKREEKIAIYNSERDTDVHRHDFLEIVYFKSGIGSHYINGKSYTITSGNICLLNTGVEHYYQIQPNESKKEIEVKNIIFYPSFLDEAYSSTNFIDEAYRNLMKQSPPEHNDYIQLSQDYNKDFLALISLIEHELLLKEPGYLNVVKNCLCSILIKIFRKDLLLNKKPSLLLKNIEIIEQALSMLDKRYNETITLNDIAKHFNYSSVYFNTLFYKHTGLTFKKYLQKLRCEKAKQFLKETDLTIANICEQVGYSDMKFFFSLFKSIVGLTPNEYRKKHRPQSTIPLQEEQQ